MVDYCFPRGINLFVDYYLEDVEMKKRLKGPKYTYFMWIGQQEVNYIYMVYRINCGKIEYYSFCNWGISVITYKDFASYLSETVIVPILGCRQFKDGIAACKQASGMVIK
jgi:hypothetical protein